MGEDHTEHEDQIVEMEHGRKLKICPGWAVRVLIMKIRLRGVSPYLYDELLIHHHSNVISA